MHEQGSDSESASESGRSPSASGNGSFHGETRAPLQRRNSKVSAIQSLANATDGHGSTHPSTSWVGFGRRAAANTGGFDLSEPVADSWAITRLLNRVGYTVCYLLASLRVWLMSGELLPILNTLASATYLYVVPYQAAFTETGAVTFDSLYLLGYLLDFLVVSYRVVKAGEVWPVQACARQLTGWCTGLITGGGARRSRSRRGAASKTKLPTRQSPARIVPATSVESDGGRGVGGGGYSSDESYTSASRRRKPRVLTMSTTEGVLRMSAQPPLASRAEMAHERKRSRRKERAEKVSRAAEAVKLLLALPYDVLLWGGYAHHAAPPTLLDQPTSLARG